MTLHQILLALRARYKVALVVALLTSVAGTIISMHLPKRYSAETSVMVDVRSPDPVATVLLPAMMHPGTLGTQVGIITSHRTAQKVVRMLRLDESPAVRAQWQEATEGKGKLEDWLGELLKKGLKITPSRDGNVLTIAYTGRDPVFTAAVANAFAQAYIEASIELKVEPARQYARWFGDQGKSLRENMENAQVRLSEFQRRRGIVATDERLDHEVTKLNELSARLTAAQAEIREARSKQRAGSGDAEVLPEVLNSPVVAGLRSNIAQLEAKLKEAGLNLGSRHPQFLRMASELAELKSRLEEESRRVSGSFTATGSAGKTREAELIAAIEAQTRKVLEMKKGRDEAAILERDVEAAKRAFEAVTNRFNQASLESQATQTNVSVLTPAVEPLAPTFPKPLEVMALLSIVAGVVLGVIAALALEMVDRRVRSTQDLAAMLQLPVLGELTHAGPPRRIMFRRRGAALAAR